MEETELIKKLKSGDSEAFEKLYEKYTKKIYDFLYFRIFHKETAEDITQIVFVKVFQKIGQFDETKNFSSWMYAIAQNSLIDHFRSAKKSLPLESAMDLDSGKNPEVDVENLLLFQKVKKLLEVLDPQSKDVVILRVWGDMSHKQIAEALKISESSSKVVFHRAVIKLKENFSDALLLLFVIYMGFR